MRCTAGWQVTVQDPDSLSANPLFFPASGPTAADGGIILTDLSGGTPPITVDWSNGQTGPILAHTLPGPYSATLTDANGCQRAFSYLLDFLSATSGPSPTHLQVFPNPFDDHLRVESPLPVRLSLFDAYGKAVAQWSAGHGVPVVQPLPSGLPAGWYRLEWSASDGAFRGGKWLVKKP